MGAPVIADLPDGARAIVTATGPDQTATVLTSTTAAAATVQEQTPAAITVTVASTRGTPTLAAAGLICRDEAGSAIKLTRSAQHRSPLLRSRPSV